MATFPKAASPSQQPPGSEDEDPSLDEYDLYSLAHSYLACSLDPSSTQHGASHMPRKLEKQQITWGPSFLRWGKKDDDCPRAMWSGRPERSYQERSCCPHQPPQPWWAREEAGDQASEYGAEKAEGTALRQSWR
ncbi:nuclear protein 1 isoform X1 [Rhinolophus sinicus]|uniref:nuclear protein 1 isoform X1 n=1 Tax=Rhinolophus sinicus TaxID=89399 RepID=UPI003D7B2899